MSNAFTALIWWVIPLAGLLGALGYVVWVTQFKSKFESETTRSVGQFQRFQDSFRTAEITTNTAANADELDELTDPSTDGAPAGSSTSD
ncbi:hypothetical protein A1sIIB106_00950 [Candidatus Planktophila lacus]|jgi:hypothetical protein|uniref:hypothetical protein n=1 Tax=Candidatus Planktophila lacus TaxID=1884913 RepID=UPI000BAC9164|nr:hypothetical protein [Candidatus Planktophila lacus]ASY24642.1 hypothetical protein A1sIIB106_00950 [Candidatus Planktophila lacus]